MSIYRMGGVDVISAGTAAKSVEVGYRTFLLSNLSEAATVYVKEHNGVDCTADNGFGVPAGEMMPIPMTAETLSIAASGEADVRILYLE